MQNLWQVEMARAVTPLDILLVIDSLGSGGAQRQMVSLACGLVDRGFRVTLFNYYPQFDHFRDELEKRGISIVDSHKNSRFDTGPLRALRKLLANDQFDAAIAFLDTPNLYLILSTIMQSKTKVVVSERMMFSDGSLSAKTWIKYQAYRFADAITVNSEHQRDRIFEKFGWSRKKLVTIWNGVDLERYSPAFEAGRDEPKHWSILAAGTIEHRKNAFNLIKAARIAVDHGAKLSISWAGKIQANVDGRTEFERCRPLIADLDLESCWEWLGECSGMHTLYPNFDFLVHPSFVEGLPNVLCEGLACGLPFLASSVGDHALLADNGRNGWLFDPYEPESIAEALLEATSLPMTEYEAMSRNARSFAESKLSQSALVDAYEQLLLGLARG